MKKKNLKFLKNLLETPSPTGAEVPVANLVRERLANTADEIETNVMGSVHARLAGKGAGPSLMLAAHMDEIGLMVTYISDEGYLSVAAVGGVDAAILPGMRVDVHAHSGVLRGVVGRKPIHLIEADERKKVTPIDKLVIDLGMPAKRVKKLVHIGDEITFGVGFERFGEGMAVSRAFDDKCGVWIAVRVLEKLAQAGRASGDFVAAATVQEEIGVRGGETSAYGVHPDVGLAFDVTHATDYPGIDKTKYGSIVCGGGPVIARGPNINPVVFDRLVAAAKAEGIKYQIEAEPGVTGTDARAIQIARGGIPCGLVSVPLRYMHTPTEVVALSDLEDTVRLIVRFALDLDETVCFVPGMAPNIVPVGETGADGEEGGAEPADEQASEGELADEANASECEFAACSGADASQAPGVSSATDETNAAAPASSDSASDAGVSAAAIGEPASAEPAASAALAEPEASGEFDLFARSRKQEAGE